MPDEPSPSHPSLRQEGDVWVLHLGDGENRFDLDSTARLLELVSQVEDRPPPRALVTAATGKIWCNGLDLDWMMANQEHAGTVVERLHRLLGDVLGAGIPTVAAVQGHAFAGGAMLATAHDVVVMREDRGYWCVPEVDLGLPFTPGMDALLKARLPRRTAHHAMTTGRRYGGPDAVAAGIADEVAPLDEVLPRAIEIAAGLAGKDPATLRAIKHRLHADAIDALDHER
ncbi:enoyl-CoA hydratase/isomerase family protein [Dermatobacter hominis]|uniref:enoyl-CoA hydratase/isomerase family protein n=1 Tax=Dermatobacter hominis TaxID=2884263 RepID=UPI001D1287D6|nr:enoyl-CoA hydratase/isomerase family protein [Dermatobacter hominis]UDY35225.1 enoyl-CoA hydratase/isomerase family protein [Dermatobacter hominis]